MEIKILQVFYGKDGLPYKDKERQVHFPIAGTGFLGASNTTQIKFYYDEIDNLDETTWVAVSKLPNGRVGSRVLESYLDEELNEHYALLELDNYYTQYKGDVFISLQGYQGGVDFDYDEENSQYEIHGTPTIAATGSIKFTINYANQFVGSGETDNITLQRILAALGTKLGMRAYSEHVEELPSEGSPDVFYVVNDDPNNPNLANIYIWNGNTRHYIWVGDNTLNLGDYYTQEEGQEFETGIDNRVSSVENELLSVASGSPSGAYANLAAVAAAFPTGNSNIYITLDDGHWCYWNGSAWTDGGVYLSTGNAVPETRKIAGITLESDITVKQLADALGISYGYVVNYNVSLPQWLYDFILDVQPGNNVTDIVIKNIYIDSSTKVMYIDFKSNGTLIENYPITPNMGGIGLEYKDDIFVSMYLNWSALNGVTGLTTLNATFKTEYLQNHVGIIYILKSISANTSNINDNTTSINKLLSLSGYKGNMIESQNQINEEIYNFFLDVNLERSSITELKINYILKKFLDGGTYYNLINIDFKSSGTLIQGYSISSAKGGNGIEYIKDTYLSVLVNWDALTNNTYFGLNITITDAFAESNHEGLIKIIKNLETLNENVGLGEEYDQFFTKNGKLLGYSNHIQDASNIRVCAKYYRVDLGSKITKVMCRFIQRSQYGSLMLITLNEDRYGLIGNIERKSNHSGFWRERCGFSSYGIDVSNPDTEHITFSSPLTIGQEYEIGYEFLGNDQIKVYLPDGTNQTITVNGIDECNGRYFILEYFWDGFSGDVDEFGTEWCPICTGIKVECENGKPYIDDFKRPSSALQVSPTGHVYTTCRNNTEDDSIYDITN